MLLLDNGKTDLKTCKLPMTTFWILLWVLPGIVPSVTIGTSVGVGKKMKISNVLRMI
jgi:hypothetical protein